MSFIAAPLDEALRGRWKWLVGIGVRDHFDKETVCGVARLNDAGFEESSFLRVEMEFRLALLFVRSVAGEAVVREDGQDIAIETYRDRSFVLCRSGKASAGDGHDKGERREVQNAKS